MKKIITLAIAAAALALGSAGTAQADGGYYTAADRAYLTTLDGLFNVNMNSAPQAIRWGRAACNLMDRGYASTTVAVAMDELPEFRAVPSAATGYLVGAAIGAYCPWNG